MPRIVQARERFPCRLMPMPTTPQESHALKVGKRERLCGQAAARMRAASAHSFFSRGTEMPSLRILEDKVLEGTPKSLAAPLGPLTRPCVRSSVFRI